jgi:V-type H+-transporting ATPase subunit H
MDVVSADEQDPRPAQWVLTVLYDMLREDSSCFGCLEEALQQQVDLTGPLIAVLGRQSLDPYVADKTAWLLSAMVGNMPSYFSEQQVKNLVEKLLESKGSCSELGVLEALANLLKTDVFRSIVWKTDGVADRIFRVHPRTAGSPVLYKMVFCIWTLSFDRQISKQLKDHSVIKKLKDILASSRVEKVVRISLTVLKQLLAHKDLCEEIVEENLLEAIQMLEFEKWRDAELYDDIREAVQTIASEVNEMSNFDRYERELQTGSLQWGFIHSSKFWADNVLKFEDNGFRALKMLASLLLSPGTDSTTLAVACHDLGEFVTLHPLGKKKVAQLNVKERIMELMSSTDASHREVRREALLCCQKIMLNKWAEMDNVPK